jgi:hypothetical protein
VLASHDISNVPLRVSDGKAGTEKHKVSPYLQIICSAWWQQGKDLGFLKASLYNTRVRKIHQTTNAPEAQTKRPQ